MSSRSGPGRQSQQDRGGTRAARAPVQDRPAPAAGPYAEILDLQQAAGNQAVSHWLQAGMPRDDQPASSGDPLSGQPHWWLEQSAGPLPPITLRDDADAQHVVQGADAHAAARGSEIVGEPGAFDGPEGMARLAHEVAHVIQQQASGLPRASEDQAEADADQFAQQVSAGQRAAVQVSAPVGWAFDKKKRRASPPKARPGDEVESMIVSKSPPLVKVNMKSGDVFTYRWTQMQLPTDRTEFTASLTDKGGIQVDAPGETVLYIEGSDKQPILRTLKFPSKFRLAVVETIKAGGGGTGKGAGQGTGKGTGQGVGEGPGKGGKKAEGEKKTTGGEVKQPGGTGEKPKEPGEKGLPPEVRDFYKGTETPQGQQIPTDKLLQMYETYKQFIKGQPQWGDVGKDFKQWVEFLQANEEKLTGQLPTTPGGKLSQEVLEELLKKLEKGRKLELPDEREKELAAEARKARAAAGLEKLKSDPSVLLMPKADRELLLELAKKYPDLFTDAKPGQEVKQLKADAKRALALQISVKYMPGEIGASLVAMVKSPTFWLITAGTIALYVGLWLAPEPFSKIAATALTAFLLTYTTFDAILTFADAWMKLSDTCKYDANTADDLEKAGIQFAKDLGPLGAQILMLIALWIVGRGARAVKNARAPKGTPEKAPPPAEGSKPAAPETAPTPKTTGEPVPEAKAPVEPAAKPKPSPEPAPETAPSGKAGQPTIDPEVVAEPPKGKAPKAAEPTPEAKPPTPKAAEPPSKPPTSEPVPEGKAPEAKAPAEAKATAKPATPSARSPEIAIFGRGVKAELIKFWRGKIRQTKDPKLIKQYKGYIDNIRQGKRPTWRQSELEIEYFYEQIGGSAQKSYKGAKQVPSGTKGSTRPDVVHSTTALEVKNYKITNAGKLIKELVRQIGMRRTDLAYDIRQQSIILDMRGQKVPMLELLRLARRVAAETGVPIENIQIVTW
ncbi:MAG: DUF4157 domain-containing protein [Chloroflexi bacterium]|nr:DUF4157 domain-containing protein [Chloroflexota bacterium]